MLWTDEYIDNLDRGGLVDALTVAFQFTQQVETVVRRGNEIEAQIQAVQKKAQEMEAGPKKKMMVIAAVIFIVMLSFVMGLEKAFVLVLILMVICVVLDKVKFSVDRKNKALEFRSQNLPQLYQAKEATQKEYQAVCSSENAKNVKLLLPDNYLASGKIKELLNLLQSRRARTLADAMNIYENNEHHRRVEAMSQEQLRVAHEAADATKRAAASAARTEEAVKEQNRKLGEMQEQQERDRKTLERQIVQAERSATKSKSKGATKTCFHCKLEIPKKAHICPHCGRPPYAETLAEAFFDKF